MACFTVMEKRRPRIGRIRAKRRPRIGHIRAKPLDLGRSS